MRNKTYQFEDDPEIYPTVVLTSTHIKSHGDHMTIICPVSVVRFASGQGEAFGSHFIIHICSSCLRKLTEGTEPGYWLIGVHG